MKARGNLEKELKDDLRSTHYKLGYMQDANQTTHQSAYIPYQVVKPTFNDPNLRKSHFDLNMNSKTMLNEKTIYMTDYTEKVAVE